MPDSSESRNIRLEVINGKNIQVPSKHIPAGIYISVKVDSQRRRKSAISVSSSNKSVASSHSLPALSVEIRASCELGRMLGGGEVVGGLQMSWNGLLDHGDEPFDLSPPPVRGVYPSLKLKATIVHACNYQDDALFDSLLDCEIARDTDAGHVQFAAYVTSKTVSHLNDAVEHFQLVLDQCPVSHPDHATALTNLAWARLKGYIRNDLQDIDVTTSLFRNALALHGTYLRSIAAGKNGVDYVIGGCNNLPTDASDEGIHLRRVVLELCPLGHQLRSSALGMLAHAVEGCFNQHGNIDDLDTSIQLCREAVSLCPEGHAVHADYLDNLAVSLVSRYNHQGKPNDLNEAISLHEEALRLRPVGHKYRDSSINDLGLYCEALTLRPPGHPHHDTTLNNLALTLNTSSEDLNEAIDLFRESLRLKRLDHPGRHATLINLSSMLCSRFTQTQKNEDVEEAITLCKQSLKALDLP
ncbi:uncharacterized protein F5891DRAFT_1181151 [Suillus fuscotomentosus]|uniref:Uncharacterized protein n=1 Tax=Suillus fuscotomentosus TaxID=1912939 RepID=A0AAD4EIG8_9AGAM|nr:uncharacterized protein F5891DRAFT_1181151 [Suillus fuscotomentosus]KAG1906835.1 hypothetical protein F5891DRAFT_1181151 [Suillus fuscotomentosus]